jgi:hypothetical protein
MKLRGIPTGIFTDATISRGGTPGIDVDQKRLRWHVRRPQMPLLLAKNCVTSVACRGQVREQACGRGQTSCSNRGGNPTCRHRVGLSASCGEFRSSAVEPRSRLIEVLLRFPSTQDVDRARLQGIYSTVGRRGQALQCLGYRAACLR